MNAGQTMPNISDTTRSLRGPFVPLLLLLLGFLSWTAVQTAQLLGDRSALDIATTQQATALETAQKIRAAADSLASKTQALANSGNPNAQAIVGELKRRGVTINPSATAAAPPP
jgi:hypothetical protein